LVFTADGAANDLLDEAQRWLVLSKQRIPVENCEDETFEGRHPRIGPNYLCKTREIQRLFVAIASFSLGDLAGPSHVAQNCSACGGVR
jgi:hypothetical protein